VAVLSHEGIYPVMYGGFPVPVGSGYRTGYIARPDKAGRFPTALILPGLLGLTAQEKAMARAFARRGIATVVVDCYPERPSSQDDALRLYHLLDDGEAVRILDETAQFLASPDVDWSIPDRHGVLGIDVGGRFAIIAGASRPWVASLALMSTPLTGDESRRHQVADVLEHLPTPVLAMYGAADPLIVSDTVDEAQRRNPSGSWLLYENSRHGFADEASPDYDQAAAADALARLVQFFTTTLPAPEVPDLG
jgi:dienelactone hydrolase